MAEKPRKVTIIGAGLGGALLAVQLGRAGHEIELYERRPDPRSGRVPAGRSINLALSTRGIAALREVELADAVLKAAVPMPGRMIHDPQGNLTFQPYDKDPNRHINSISRAELNRILVEAAEALPNCRVEFDYKCVDVDLDAPSAILEHNETGEQIETDGRVLIGADGAFSAVRAKMQRLDRFDYSQSYLSHGYKELTIPPADDEHGPFGKFRMEPRALHIWPRRSYMMIALPNNDGSFTCTCFWPFEGPHGFAQLKTSDQVRRYFVEHFPDAVPLMPTLADDYQHNPTSSLVTVRCGPWHYRDRVALLGDAAHAIVPFYGQGMNCAFEDCSVLSATLAEAGDDWATALPLYYERRKRNADTLADLALYNFIEMRDHAGSPAFQRKKARERWLAKTFPKWYVPLYTLVSFTQTPYAEAVEQARRQERIVAGVFWTLVALVTALLLWIVLAIVF